MEEKIRVCGKEKEEAGGRLAQVKAEFNEIDAEYKKLKVIWTDIMVYGPIHF